MISFSPTRNIELESELPCMMHDEGKTEPVNINTIFFLPLLLFIIFYYTETKLLKDRAVV